MKYLKPFLCSLFLLTLLWGNIACSRANYQNLVQVGDIVFQVSNSPQSQAIQLATGSKYTHMGIIYLKKGKPHVFEAIQPVTFTPLDEWIRRGQQQHVVIKRLRHTDSVLNAKNSQAMYDAIKQHMNKNYDFHFAWDDNKMYCSELVWKVYQQAFNIKLARLRQMRDFDLSHPIVKQALLERYGQHIPLGEYVIAPSDIFASELLETVYSQ